MVYVCVCVCVYIYIHIYICECLCMCIICIICMYMFVCMYEYTMSLIISHTFSDCPIVSVVMMTGSTEMCGCKGLLMQTSSSLLSTRLADRLQLFKCRMCEESRKLLDESLHAYNSTNNNNNNNSNSKM